MLELQRKNLIARDKFFGWFGLPATLIVVGSVLIGERLLFGQISSAAKVLAGAVLLILGISYFLYVLYLKKSRGGDA
jgi:hypothetical protein